MQNIKYQIFVSSTYEDLKEERDQVIKACLEMGHIPVGMEMFSAADEEQWKIITRQIDQSDYYIVIVAHRYGSVVDGQSYTEKEYDYAVSQGVPTLGFIIDDSAPWPTNRTEHEDTDRHKLLDFKKKVRLKPVDTWSSKDDLHAKCAIALMKSFNTRPRPGWVRAPEVTTAEVAGEISRLSSENSKLRAELEDLKQLPDVSHFAQGEDRVELGILNELEEKGHRVTATWDSLFTAIGGAIITGPEEDNIKTAIILLFAEPLKIPRTEDAYRYKLLATDFKKIKTQLVSLGLIEVNYVTRTYDGWDPNFGKAMKTEVSLVWKLTKAGERRYAELAALRH